MKTAQARVRTLIALLFLAWGGTAGAYWIGLVPASGNYQQGSPFTIDVVITGLATEGQILSTYDFLIAFDPAIVGFTAAQSGGALGAGSLFDATAGVGSVNLFELSVLSDAELAALQGDTLTLASLTFLGLGLGTSTIDFSLFFALGGAQVTDPQTGGTQTFDLLSLPFDAAAASATIVPRTVPEPGTAALLALALASLVARTSRAKR
jgi:hypothetical protein